MKILTVIGARPQFIKAAAVSREIARRAKSGSTSIQEILVHTGQHYDDNMSQVFFEELNIPKPDYNLGVGSGSHGEQTAQMLASIEKLLFEERPDWLLVYGDTNSTLAGALAAAKLHIPVAHVEAGLRSYNRQMPEELNRVLTDHIATLLFCPTVTAVRNLQQEGFVRIVEDGQLTPIVGSYNLPPNKPTVVNVGDVMYDSLLFYLNMLDGGVQTLGRFGLEHGGYCLATVHRAENTDDRERFQEILSGFNKISETMSILWPVHPRTRRLLEEFEGIINPKGIRFIEPLGYLDCLALQRNAHAILTDSGGVQKEAYLLGIPCITLRDETEWVETVEAGANVLVGANTLGIVEAFESLAERKADIKDGRFGDGAASIRIVDTLVGNCADTSS